MFELWISDGFEWFFVVNFLYPKVAVLARSKQLILMPFTVKFPLDFLVCGFQGRLLWHLSMSAPCFDCWVFSNSGFEVRQAFSCTCWLNVNHCHCRKEICSTRLFQESIAAILYCKAIHLMKASGLSVRLNYWVGSHNPARTSSWHLSMSAPCFHVTKARKQWRIEF